MSESPDKHKSDPTDSRLPPAPRGVGFWVQVVLVILLAAVIIIVILALLGPAIGNVESGFNSL